ncbi:MAG: hypothetical protein H7246_19840 [Phycisphaerae bacterium]|nr:hypothetical protein [Saprospiraceae bacterium]
MRSSLLLLCFILATKLSSQTESILKTHYLEGGILLGISNYSGDLSEKRIHLSESKLAYGGFVRYFLSSHFALRAHFFAGSISGEDANAEALLQQQRSFRFKTDLREFGLVGEYHVFGRGESAGIKRDNYLLSPYLYLGIGGTFTRKKVEYYGAPEDRSEFVLVPLPEGGQREQFLVFPMGVGVLADLTKDVVLGLEVGWRPSVSDQLDGVSLNGNPDKKDWYYFGGVTLTFILNKQKEPNNPNL